MQQAERHAQADRDVAELGGALDRVAEELPQGREVGAIGEQADAIAELEHEVRAAPGGRRRRGGRGSRPTPCRPAARDRRASGPPRSAGTRRRAGSRGPGDPAARRPGAASPSIACASVEHGPGRADDEQDVVLRRGRCREKPAGSAGRGAAPRSAPPRAARPSTRSAVLPKYSGLLAGRSRAAPGPKPAGASILGLQEREGRDRGTGWARPRRTGRRPSSPPRGRRCRASRSPPAASAWWCPSPRRVRVRTRP